MHDFLKKLQEQNQRLDLALGINPKDLLEMPHIDPNKYTQADNALKVKMAAAMTPIDKDPDSPSTVEAYGKIEARNVLTLHAEILKIESEFKKRIKSENIRIDALQAEMSPSLLEKLSHIFSKKAKERSEQHIIDTQKIYVQKKQECIPFVKETIQKIKDLQKQLIETLPDLDVYTGALHELVHRYDQQYKQTPLTKRCRDILVHEHGIFLLNAQAQGQCTAANSLGMMRGMQGYIEYCQEPLIPTSASPKTPVPK